MIIKTFRSLKYIFVAFISIGFLMSCADQAQLKPWDNTSLTKVSFTFADTDMDKGEIGGDINLDLPPALKPSGVAKYVIYWGSSAADSGKGAKLAEVSTSLTGSLLYRVPENEKIKGSFFLLYLKGSNNQEVWSGKSVQVEDNFKEETAETPAAAEDKPQQVDQATDTPVVDATPVTPVATVDTPSAAVDAGTSEDTAVKPATVETGTVEPSTDEPATVTQEDVEIQKLVITIENVLFEFDRSYLRNEFKEQLNKDFAAVENKGETEILIAGHADERGSNEYNLALGERRAYTVKRYLVSLGFLSENIRIISYGEEKPLERGHNESAWEKNRRAETKILDNE